MGHSRQSAGLRRASRLVSLVVAGALAASTADAAPVLPKATAASANDLQRAVWACEAGAQAKAAAHSRFFLGTVDHGAGPGDQPPLVLTGSTLTGLGQASNDKGWFNIGFTCSLTPALDAARSFTPHGLWPVKPSDAVPSPAIPAATGKTWYVGGADRLTLTHGVRETDDRDFVATCNAKSGAVDIRLTRSAPWLKAGGYATIAITANGKSLLYVARGALDENLGAVIPVMSVPAGDPLFAQMTAGADMSITIGADVVYAVLLKGAAAPVRSFVAGCARG
jgi:hypothetical protein